MKKNRILIDTVVILTLLTLIAPSCKRYYDPPPYFEDNTDTVEPSSRKVLIIAIDGAVGSEYKTIQPPVLTGLQAHSKYSYEAVSDEVTTDAASWKTLISGTSYFKHQIRDSSFLYSQPAGGSEHTAPPFYPSFFNYLLSSSRPDTKTSFISSWKDLNSRLATEVEDQVVSVDDAAVKDSAVTRLKNGNSDIMVVQFNGTAIAGRASGFSSTDYKDAVLKVDGYIGELMTTLKARPEYNKKEEWLVIITGTHGGDGNSYGGPTEKEANVISFYYNENMKSTELIRNGSFAGVQFKGRDDATIKAQVLDDGGLYNAGTGQQTIQIKIKGPGPGAYPHFFSKMVKWPSTSGWSMFTSGSSWAISVRSTTSGERRIQASSPNVFDNQWHTLTVVIYDSAGGKWVKRFTDGARVADVTSTVNLGSAYGSIESAAPLMLGWGADPSMGAVTFFASDVRIFNTALTDDEVLNNLCLTDITQHPKYANLVGYWPGSDGYGGRLKNKLPGKKDFILQGSYQWLGVAELPCTIAANTSSGSTSLLVKSVDVVPTVFYWLRIPVASSWGLEGTSWLSQYETEFVKL
ncbi:MAG: DUF4983 domain-containing protein [Flavisolibacter sp.]